MLALLAVLWDTCRKTGYELMDISLLCVAFSYVESNKTECLVKFSVTVAHIKMPVAM